MSLEKVGARLWLTLQRAFMHVGTVSVTVSCGTVCFAFHVFLQLDHNRNPKWDNSAYFIFRLEVL